MINPIRKHLNIVRMMAVVLICLIAFFVFMLSTRLKNINVVGNTHYSGDEIAKKLKNFPLSGNTFVFCFKHKLKKIENIPFIGDYEIIREDRHTVTILIYENNEIGYVTVMGKYFIFDKEGLVLSSTSEKPREIPLVSGLGFDEIIVSKNIKASRYDMFETVLTVMKLLKKENILIDELEFNSQNEVVLYSGDLKILLGKRKNYDIVISALSNVFESAYEKGGTLDMSFYGKGNYDIILR